MIFLDALQVRHIKAKYGDFFGITVAGYPGMMQVSSLVYDFLAFGYGL